jgi:beta-glucosidase
VHANSPGSKVGIVLNLSAAEPASPSPADYHAARRHDGWFNRWFLDPLFGRHYPADMVAQYIAEGHLPPGGPDFVQDGDFEAMASPTDVFGINYYTRQIVRDDEARDNLAPTTRQGPEITEMGWEVYPNGLYNLLNRLHFEYHMPEIYITENGASYSDGPNGDGKIHDEKRIAYLQSHLAAAYRAIQNGVPLTGYFCWTILDNFEWAKGFAQRFGMVWVDYETLERTPKDSARWYSDAIKRNGIEA